MTQKEANIIAYRAASASSRIRATEPDPKLWAPLIVACEEDIRELVRIYLVQWYQGQRHRERAAREKGGPQAAAAIAELNRKLYGDNAPSRDDASA